MALATPTVRRVQLAIRTRLELDLRQLVRLQQQAAARVSDVAGHDRRDNTEQQQAASEAARDGRHFHRCDSLKRRRGGWEQRRW